MKIEVLSRSETQYTRATRNEPLAVHQSLRPELHPFEKEREYVRALRAAKMSKIFAKPFVGALEGHRDGILCMATSSHSLETLVSGACDGEIRVWDLPSRRAVWSAPEAHTGFVRGVAVCCEGETFVSCGDDKTAKLWSVNESYAASFPRRRPRDGGDEADEDRDDPYGDLLDDDLKVDGDLDGKLTSRLRRIHPSRRGYLARDDGDQQEEPDDDADVDDDDSPTFGNSSTSRRVAPLSTYLAREMLAGCDCSWSQDAAFATCGDTVALWDKTRAEPLHRFSWPNVAESIVAVKYNPAETSLLASVGGADRSVVLYDVRDANPIRRVVQSMRNNQLAWNPLEPFHFTTANEDWNLYTFDVRKLDKAAMVHKDHVAAVLDVAYSPTGRELVSGSFDRSIRIFPVRGNGRSREVYTAPRMQRVFAVRFSADSRFVLSGSDDFNIRVWKTQASRPLGVISGRQRRQLDYSSSLLKRYGHLSEVRKIHKGRRLPKRIYKAKLANQLQEEKERRSRARTIAHSKKGAVDYVSLRRRHVLREEE